MGFYSNTPYPSGGSGYRPYYPPQPALLPEMQQPGLAAPISANPILNPVLPPGLVTPQEAAYLAQLVSLTMLAEKLAQQQPFADVELTMLLKDMVDMPKEWVALLQQLNDNPQLKNLSPPVLLQLLQEFPDVRLPLPLLQKALQQQLGQGSSQLMQLLQGNALAQAGAANPVMDRLLQTLGQWQQMAATNPVEAMSLVLQLYLPYHPGIVPPAIKWHFQGGETTEGKEGEASKNDKEAVLVILMQTGHLGRLRTQLLQDTPQSLLIFTQHEPSLTKELRTAIEARLAGNVNAVDALETAQTPSSNASKAAIGWSWTPWSHSKAPVNNAHHLAEDGAFDSASGLLSSAASEGEQVGSQIKNDAQQLAFYPQEGVSLAVLTAGMQFASIIIELDARAHRKP